MVFTTPIFVFLFLPLFLGIYYALPLRFRSIWLLLASFIFYAWWRADFLLLLAGATLWTYFIGRLIARGHRLSRAGAQASLAIGICLNIGVLAYFKFSSAWGSILPLGISFYLFKATAYLVDVYRKQCPAAESWLDLAVYIAIFPQLTAGPIERYSNLSAQLHERTHSAESFSKGAVRFMAGFCKKALIADAVAPIANAAFALARPSFADAWAGALAYTAQIFFDFSGYSDMAIGLGLMMGFRFMENFDRPYTAKSIGEFWRRWHVSLSSWLRDYLYIPLGGNRKGLARTCLNLLVVMLLGGLWHGAAWTFLLWGLWHALFLILERLIGLRAKRDAGGPLAIARTMLAVVAGWVLFRAADLRAAAAMFAGMLGLNGLAFSAPFAWQLERYGLAMIAVGFALIYLAPLFRREKWRGLLSRAGPAVVPLFALSLVKLAAESILPFLYFRF